MFRFAAFFAPSLLALAFFLPAAAQATCSINAEIPCWHTPPPAPPANLTCKVDTCVSPTGKPYCCHPVPDQLQDLATDVNEFINFEPDRCEGLTGCECSHLLHPERPGNCL